MSALAAVAWRVGWSGPGRAAGVALAVGRGVAADRTGPDRVGSAAVEVEVGVAAQIRAGSPAGRGSGGLTLPSVTVARRQRPPHRKLVVGFFA